MADDYVDITPRADGVREVQLTPEDIEMIRNNPGGLTKEGVMVRVWQWFQCPNFQVQMKYLAMYKYCKKFKPSGTLDDGSVILARDNRITKQGIERQWIWKEKIGQRNSLGEIIIAKDVDTLQKFVESKLPLLKGMRFPKDMTL